MAVFGDSYGQIAQQQMGLDAATANRAIASQQMLREVQRAAVAQRQQEIATQMAAQQQADYATQREQENQFRMASWLNQLQQQQRSYGLDREQMQYSRGRDVLADAFKNKGYQADISQRGIVNKLNQDEFNWRKDQPNAAKLKSDDLKARIEAEDAQNAQLARRMAEALNLQQKYFNAGNVDIPGIESAYERDSNPFLVESWRDSQNSKLSNLANFIPPSVTTNPQAMLKGLSFAEALKKVKELNDAQYTQQQGVVGELARGGAMDWVRQTDRGYEPAYVPRSAVPGVPTPAPTVDPVNSVRQRVRRLVDQGYDAPTAVKMVLGPRKF